MPESPVTSDKLIEIHHDIIQDYGGACGVRDEATLDHLIYQVNRTKSCKRKAAIILHGIASDHPFVDGNKRTAFVAAENILKNCGYRIMATDDEMVSFMIEVASYLHTRDSVEAWIKEKLEL